MVVDEKELATREQDVSPELKSHIRIMKRSIEDFRATAPGDSVPDATMTNPPRKATELTTNQKEEDHASNHVSANDDQFRSTG